MRATLVVPRPLGRWLLPFACILGAVATPSAAHAQELLANEPVIEAPEDLLAEPKLDAPAAPAPELMTEAIAPPPPSPLAGVARIVIDPGHGGEDAGVTGPTGALEKDVALSVCLELERLLKTLFTGEVILTRREDRTISQAVRAGIANRAQGHFLIAVHTGASAAPSARGFELFVQVPAVPAVLASASAQRRGQALAGDRARLEASRGVAALVAESLAAETGAPSRGLREIPSVLLGAVEMPGLLIEVGCLTNAREEVDLDSEAYRKRVAQGIAAGIARALGAAAEPPQ